jgi:hypothetical protein
VITFIKQTSPSSKLILICPVEELVPMARKCGADACLKDEKVAGHLLRAAHYLSDRPRLAKATN